MSIHLHSYFFSFNILGGYFGTGIGKRAGTISHFLLGIAVHDNDNINGADYQEPKTYAFILFILLSMFMFYFVYYIASNHVYSLPSIHHCRFYSFCKVGSGYSHSELQELQKMLEKSWKVYKTQSPPPYFQLAEPFKEKPDVWIHPKE